MAPIAAVIGCLQFGFQDPRLSSVFVVFEARTPVGVACNGDHSISGIVSVDCVRGLAVRVPHRSQQATVRGVRKRLRSFRAVVVNITSLINLSVWVVLGGIDHPPRGGTRTLWPSRLGSALFHRTAQPSFFAIRECRTRYKGSRRSWFTLVKIGRAACR